MDSRYLIGGLMTRRRIAADRRRSTMREENAYYMRHSPADTRILKVTSAVAAVWVGLLTVDFLLR